MQYYTFLWKLQNILKNIFTGLRLADIPLIFERNAAATSQTQQSFLGLPLFDVALLSALFQSLPFSSMQG